MSVKLTILTDNDKTEILQEIDNLEEQVNQIELTPGEDGVSPTVSVTSIDGGHNISITDVDGTKSFTVLDGAQGEKGDTGDKGEQGEVGPAGKDGSVITIVNVEESTEDGGNSVVTFSNGITLNVKNGSKGSKGDTGATGPKGETGAQGEKGDTGAQGLQGIQGPKGDKGEKGDTGADGSPGSNGYTPVRGVDYWTQTDQNAIVQQVFDMVGGVEKIKEITIETKADGYYDNDGNFISNSGYTAQRTNLVPVSAGDRFVYTGYAPYSGNVSVIWYSNETTKLSSERHAANRGAVMLEAPAGASFARFFSLDAGSNNVIGFSVYYVPKTLPYEIVVETRDGGYFDYNNGEDYKWSEQSGQSKYTNPIPVVAGDQFDYTGFSKWSIAGVVWSDSSGNKLLNEQYNDGGSGVASARVTAPSGAAFVRFFSFSYGTATLIVTKVTKESEETALLNSNVLWGKKYVACGDSFTEGAYPSKTEENWSDKFQCYKTYPFWIANRNNMDLVNEAKSGSDFTNIDGAVNAFSVSRYKTIPTDADYITLMFGLNEIEIGDDSNLIGANTDTTNTTLWGAFNTVFEYLLTNMPYAKIGVIIADAWMTKNYSDAVKDICKYWGIPYLDLKGDDTPMSIGGKYTAISPKAKQLRDSAFQVSSSDSHPNVKAHEYRSTIIENFLRSL